jgi:predicted small metal-binding protein
MDPLTSSEIYLPPARVNQLPGRSLNNLHEHFTETVDETQPLSLRCMDIGLDCSFEARGKTKTRLMREFIVHAASSHKMRVLSAEILLKIKESLNK